MKRQEVIKLLKGYNIAPKEFFDFMHGQTVGFEGGIIDYYTWDVDTFLRRKGVK